MYPLKTLYAIIVVALLSSCQKVLDYAESKVEPVAVDLQTPSGQLRLDEFKSMLTKDTWYAVGRYYTSDATLEVPIVNTDDRYNFDLNVSDGSIDSKEPCIEYHYIIKTYLDGSNILFDWLNFSIAPTTFTVYDYKVGEWFVLKIGDKYVKYVSAPDPNL
jgi:hypothetical protein